MAKCELCGKDSGDLERAIKVMKTAKYTFDIMHMPGNADMIRLFLASVGVNDDEEKKDKKD